MLLALTLCEIQKRLCESSVRSVGTDQEYALNGWIECASMADCATLPITRVTEIFTELQKEYLSDYTI